MRVSVVAVPVLRGERPETQTLLNALAEVWVQGVEVDWSALFPDSARRVGLPTYAFQRERYWLKASPVAGDATSIGLSSAEHPLLDAAVGLADGNQWLFTGRLSLESHPWLSDHVVLGVVILPGTAFLELALHAGGQVGCELVQELTLEAPLILGEQSAVALQVTVGEPDESGQRPIGVYSRPQDTAGEGVFFEHEWTRHASGVLAPADTVAGERAIVEGQASALARESWPPVGAEAVDIDDFYSRMADVGFDYGPAFLGVRAAWRRGEEVLAELSLSDNERVEAGKFGLHPVLSDAGLQGMAESWSIRSKDGEGKNEPRLPFSFTGVRLYARGASTLLVHLSTVGSDAMSLVAISAGGALVMSIRSLVVRGVSRTQTGDRTRSLSGVFVLCELDVGSSWVFVGGYCGWVGVVGCGGGRRGGVCAGRLSFLGGVLGSCVLGGVCR